MTFEQAVDCFLKRTEVYVVVGTSWAFKPINKIAANKSFEIVVCNETRTFNAGDLYLSLEEAVSNAFNLEVCKRLHCQIRDEEKIQIETAMGFLLLEHNGTFPEKVRDLENESKRIHAMILTKANFVKTPKFKTLCEYLEYLLYFVKLPF